MPRRAYSDPKPGAFARREMHRFYERASDRRTGRLCEASRADDSTERKPSMSDLVAIAYEDLATAQQVASNLGEAVKGHDIELDDLVIVERKDDGDFMKRLGEELQPGKAALILLVRKVSVDRCCPRSRCPAPSSRPRSATR